MFSGGRRCATRSHFATQFVLFSIFKWKEIFQYFSCSCVCAVMRSRRKFSTHKRTTDWVCVCVCDETKKGFLHLPSPLCDLFSNFCHFDSIWGGGDGGSGCRRQQLRCEGYKLEPNEITKVPKRYADGIFNKRSQRVLISPTNDDQMFHWLLAYFPWVRPMHTHDTRRKAVNVQSLARTALILSRCQLHPGKNRKNQKLMWLVTMAAAASE